MSDMRNIVEDLQRAMGDEGRMITDLKKELLAVKAQNKELREALERCDVSIQGWWKTVTALSPEAVLVVEAGRLANATLSNEGPK